MRQFLICLLAVGVAFIALNLGQAGEGNPNESASKDHKFGKVVLYLVTKTKDLKNVHGCALIEKPTIVYLGNRAFLVGTIPDYGDDDEYSKAAAGKRFWTPVADIVQMTEFKSMEDAKSFFEIARKRFPNRAAN